MSILSRLFGRSRQPTSDYALPGEGRFDVHRGFDIPAMRDLISGYRFCATIQLRTPLRVLRRHGEFHEGVDRVPDQIAGEMWEGMWVPEARSFRELGFDVNEMPPGSMASDIGPIPTDGGEYLNFLIPMRTAAEAPGGSEERRAAVATIVSDPKWGAIVKALGGADAILSRLFPLFISTVPRMPAKTAAALMDAGYATPDAIKAATDAQLRRFGGIGPALLNSLRDTARDASEPNSRYVDRVIR